MNNASTELMSASASMAKHAKALAALATKHAEWAADVADHAVRTVAEKSNMRKTKTTALVNQRKAASPESTILDTALTASGRVFAITELTEAILSEDTISMRQLFLLQRTSRHFSDTIKGSIALRLKLWLQPKPDLVFSGINPLLIDLKQRPSCLDDVDLRDD
nr:hypothetical protein B0A51_03083 [Rachicladosporium sp. CCFEE 5018]